jgi:hypothetical protein
MPAMTAEDPVVAPLAEALRARGARVEVAPAGESPHVPLPARWEDYLKALGSQRRYLVTRSLRELDRWAPPGADGGWTLRRARTPEDLREGRDVLRALHAERWTAAGRDGAFASERFTRFHDEVMPRLLAGEDGAELELSWLVARGAPIAAAYNVVAAGRVQFYQAGGGWTCPRTCAPGSRCTRCSSARPSSEGASSTTSWRGRRATSATWRSRRGRSSRCARWRPGGARGRWKVRGG